MSADLAFRPIARLATDLQRRTLSPVEITKAFLARIERHNGRLNAYLTVTGEEALRDAAAAEREIAAGRYRGPLHGIPFSLKDLFATRGVRTTAGSKILANWVPTEDAFVVARLKEAGAVLLGKTHMHEFAYGVTNENAHYGPARNPWDPERVPGGSSGGSAAAVAAGLCAGTLGTDTGGSIRIPSALCGVVGLKPTYGRVSRRGVVPLCWSLDHVGPLARTTEDAALILQAIAGHDPGDPASARLPVPDYRAGLEGGVRGLAFGVPREFFFDRLDPEVRAHVDAALKALEGLGARLVPIALPHSKYVPAISFGIQAPEAFSYHEKTLRTRAAEYGDDVRVRLEVGRYIPAPQYLKAQRARRLVMEDFRRAFQTVTAILTPTVPIPATPIGAATVPMEGKPIDVRGALTRFARSFNATGLPTITVPCGFTAGGLPVALQIAGHPFDEATVLRVAHALEQAGSWTCRVPPGCE
jgi:aspartyl-tRNA(Asn)/glutamyl-tRNA(Gln) amidotransferase subunit A